jgi:hypothetical protein
VKIIIEVEGGCVQAVYCDGEAETIIVDFDNMAAGPLETEPLPAEDSEIMRFIAEEVIPE